jgi:phosphonate degradation associated HDIG domain protein
MGSQEVIGEIFARFTRYGHLEYGESVTQEQHALQTACFAEREGADTLLIAATLLHDFGHLLHDEDAADQDIDALHEELGARFLQHYFVPEVVEPGRLHVQAKRYLCAVDPEYFSTLSPASVQSLELQGGPFNPTEKAKFEALPHWQAAIRLRRWDDLGKDPTMETPPLAHYRPHIEAGLKPSA